jgi:hypothetical protein
MCRQDQFEVGHRQEVRRLSERRWLDIRRYRLFAKPLSIA